MKKKQKINRNAPPVLQYLLILLLFGILTGILLSYFFNNEDKTLLKEYFMQSSEPLFSNICYEALLVFIQYLVCSTTILGPILISFMFFSRAVQMGFTSILFLHTYGIEGILGILCSLLPSFIVDMSWMILLSSLCIQFSIRIFQCSITIKKLQWKVFIQPFFNSILTIIIMIILASYLKATLFQQLTLLFQKVIT